jgi:F-type H+-transporting ATPase subunit delta
LRKIADLAKDGPLMALLESPKLSFPVKKALLRERLGEINPLALNLACLLISEGRLRAAEQISQEYGRRLDAYHGIEHAEVITALPLDDEDREKVSSYLGEGELKVIIDAQVDPSIVGGLKVKIGDRLIDGSIRNRLESLKKSLVEVGR